MSPKKAFKPNTKTKRKHHKKIWKPKTACPSLFCLFSHDNDMILLSQDHFLMIKEQVPSDKKLCFSADCRKIRKSTAATGIGVGGCLDSDNVLRSVNAPGRRLLALRSVIQPAVECFREIKGGERVHETELRRLRSIAPLTSPKSTEKNKLLRRVSLAVVESWW